MTTFLRLLSDSHDEKSQALLRIVLAIREGRPQDIEGVAFERNPSLFSAVPGSAFTYWVSQQLIETFSRVPPFLSDGRCVKQGLATADDFRWVRLWWESSDNPNHPTRLVPFTKGGSSVPFYTDVALGLRWGAAGEHIKAWKQEELRSGRITANNSKCWNESHYFRSGLTWPARPHRRGAFSLIPPGVIFSHTGTMVFEVKEDDLLPTCALLNSDVFIGLLHILMPRGGAGSGQTLKYELGYVSSVPVPSVPPEARRELSGLVRRGWALRRQLDTTVETSHAFVLPAQHSERITGAKPEEAQAELFQVERRLNELALALYGITRPDYLVLKDAATGSLAENGPTSDAASEAFDEDDSEQSPASSSTTGLVSWVIGVAFGRFDPRLATGERPIPPEPEPFDPLPSRSPGMYPEAEEPADRPDILVDDEGHADDLAARAQAVAERVKVDLPENLRGWLAKEFFPLHIKMYSKSRRKAPIYWQLATPSASYSVWLYIHAFSKDTLFRVQNDYAAPKLAHEERRLESLTSELREGATGAQRKQLAGQEALVEELRAFLDEVKRVAPLWKPNLDDGVIINFAPLWRLVPQNKAWQKELRSTWDALCEGKYDWAHLAMHLWPERVVPKCAKDRSLAIAHGLEDVFWLEGTDGKWTARKLPMRSVDDLVRERTSPALKSALKSLLEAPAAAGKSGGRRGGGRRKSAAAGGNT